ncbi:hypothetical protein [Kitasatospora sp. McL0602]|uniref:hypothetical protein n=1 Tax=Kitasatospora sp. McL0602 TaxID=3439530 RepID=UPI003F8ACFBC
MTAALTANALTALRYAPYGTEDNVRSEGDAHGWALMGIAVDHTGSAFDVDADGYFSGPAEEIMAQSNAAAFAQAMADACGEEGGTWVRVGGRCLFDANSTTATDAVDGLMGALADYPLLDESDHSEREWNAMCEEIDSEMPGAYPDDVDASDVLRELACPELGRIGYDDVMDAVRTLGYAPCSDCSEWLSPTTGREGEPLCRGCAVEETRPSVRVMPTTLSESPRYELGSPLTAVLTPYLDGRAVELGCAYREDVRAIVRGSADGYRQTYGRAA